MTNFESAVSAARILAHGLLAEGVSTEDIANAYIVEALAVWQAEVGENPLADELLTKWTIARDIAAFVGGAK